MQGLTAALAEGRQLEELAQLLESEGAVTLRYPLLNILDAPDPEPIRTWMQNLLANRFSHVVLMTGEALRRLVAFAEREGLREDFLQALSRTRVVTRGPKPVRALREVGLMSPGSNEGAPLSAQKPTTEGVIATLQKESLQGQSVGYTLYAEPNPTLDDFLRNAGAEPHPVLTYIYAPHTDNVRVGQLIEQLSQGKVDVLIFTSSPQVDRLYKVAQELGLEDALKQGLTRTRIASVGPVCSENLHQRGAPVHICPEQGFVMKNLVQYIKRAFAQG